MNRQPLTVRLYFQPPLYELARLIGYAGLPLPEARAGMKILAEKFGQQVLEEAAREVVSVDTSCNPPQVRLSEECLKACWGLLGPPPGHPRRQCAEHSADEATEEPRRPPKARATSERRPRGRKVSSGESTGG